MNATKLFTNHMEFHSNYRKESNTHLSPQPKQKTKLGSMLNFDRTPDDFHTQVLNNAEKDKPPHQKQQVGRKSRKSEELVMYMSRLPSYLERAEETSQEKPFSIGVLNWSLLQKWQHCNNDIVGGINGDPSPSTSKTAPLLSSKGSRLQLFETDGIVSGFKGNGVIQKGEALKTVEQVSSSAVTDRDVSERCKTAEPDSRNDPVSRHRAAGHHSGPPKAHNNGSVEGNRHTFYGGSSVKVCHTEPRSDYTRFYSVASERVKTKDSQIEKSFAKEIKSANCPSSKEQTTRFPESASISPSRTKNLEKKNSGSKPGNLAENETFQMKVGGSESTKVRNSSPTRRFSFGMGRIGKNSNLKSSATEKLVSEKIPDSKVTSTSACSNYSKSDAGSRARSSPLRRLLNPIFKSERNPSKKDRTLKSGQMDSAALHSVQRRLDMNDFRKNDIGGPHHEKKNGTSSTQALLQVAVKNGLPLFTFTVDKRREILAATVKELSSTKTACGWIYTFFSFSEKKNKNNGRWMNQGSKDRNHGYVPNIIAQMNVSDIGSSGREFVLSSVGVGDVDQTLDSFPGNELAAIVVKFPERTSVQKGTFDIPQFRNCSNSEDGEGNETAIDDVFSTSVILPGGHHGAPSKGEPSPLIERWKSGGSCDCGGWDLGCQLRILASSNHSNWRFEPSESQLDSFRLFSQEEVEDERPLFIFSTFEDGIFSVEFNSSLKLIQAFSIGIAVLHNRTSPVLSPNGKKSEEVMASENTTLWKRFNQAQAEVSAKYATNPPLSPVGRV